MNQFQALLSLIAGLAGALMLIAVAADFSIPYREYYPAIVSLSAAWFLYCAVISRRTMGTLIFAVILLVFNPLFPLPLHMTAEFAQMFQYAAAGAFLFNLFCNPPPQKVV